MPRLKQEVCTNCWGENPKCKYLETGRKCRKGKAKGKAISQATLDKRDTYDSLIGDFYTDYLNQMRDTQIIRTVDSETGEIFDKEVRAKLYSFQRYLQLNADPALVIYYRRNYDPKDFLFSDF